MFKRIDRWQALSKFFERFTTYLSKRRGLPVIIGIALVMVSFILQVFDVYSDSQLLQLLGVITHHVGILLALIGLLLTEALGS